MRVSREEAHLFGNPVPERLVRKGERMVRRYSRKYGYIEDAVYPLSAVPNPVIGELIGVQNVVLGGEGAPLEPAHGVLIGTIRMGYGHYRMSMAIASAAHSMGLTPYWFDLLSFEGTPGARIIRDMDYWYSFGSRLSQRSRLFNRFVWDPLMGKAYKRAEKNYPVQQLCRLFSTIHKGVPGDMPVVASHPFNALGALYGGLRHVVNIVPDNCPLGFHLAPGALHTVQGPAGYVGFRTLKDMGPKHGITHGIPADQIRLTGHYIDHELAANIERDCRARMDRVEKGLPRRFLLSVGGAGAQQPLFVDIVKHCLPLVRDGAMALFINAGDHRAVWQGLLANVPGLGDVAQMHTDWAETVAFARQAVDGPVTGIHAFLHDETFAAVYATNLLMRASDVLMTKPSELAYYPIPKLFLQRVGGHEAWGAIRGAELGDGTVECTSTPLALQTIDQLARENDLIPMFCEHIMKLNAAGVYNGAYRVVELARERAEA